jgi:ABC-2 type transport system ATP-binding protein
MRRRLDIALGLVHRPRVLFLDEPTTGLDPEARVAMWREVRRLAGQESLTILLTTHYLDEAQQLADRLAVLREGEIVRIGTPTELVSASGATEIRYRDDGELRVLRTEEPTLVLHELTERALAAGRELEELEVRRASLEDVYLDLMREEEAEA